MSKKHTNKPSKKKVSPLPPAPEESLLLVEWDQASQILYPVGTYLRLPPDAEPDHNDRCSPRSSQVVAVEWDSKLKSHWFHCRQLSDGRTQRYDGAFIRKTYPYIDHNGTIR